MRCGTGRLWLQARLGEQGQNKRVRKREYGKVGNVVANHNMLKGHVKDLRGWFNLRRSHGAVQRIRVNTMTEGGIYLPLLALQPILKPRK